MLLSGFFFFKQKTAYEMRISDWSSDVCSSDLPSPARPPDARPAAVPVASGDAAQGGGGEVGDAAVAVDGHRQVELGEEAAQHVLNALLAADREAVGVGPTDADRPGAAGERLGDDGPPADSRVDDPRHVADRGH